jgi:hypothetical protein
MDAVLAKISREQLRFACHIGDVDTVRRCLDRGTDIDSTHGEFKPSETPLFIACQTEQSDAHQAGCFDVVNLLLARGASPRITDRNDLTPLFVANIW